MRVIFLEAFLMKTNALSSGIQSPHFEIWFCSLSLLLMPRVYSGPFIFHCYKLVVLDSLGARIGHEFRKRVMWHFMAEAAFTLQDILLDWASFPDRNIGAIEPLLGCMANLQVL